MIAAVFSKWKCELKPVQPDVQSLGPSQIPNDSWPEAQYKGSGTINGTGDYGFLLTATDGQISGGGGADKFRIKIVDKISGAVVYDNVLGTSEDIDDANPQIIGGGSIVIHSK